MNPGDAAPLAFHEGLGMLSFPVAGLRAALSAMVFPAAPAAAVSAMRLRMARASGRFRKRFAQRIDLNTDPAVQPPGATHPVPDPACQAGSRL
ncbi:hypothetical protein [Achromobacter sp. Marseille-Q4962]|uniref:hypothetical protein n=1 Tax=Achromobacter sp. Marseille-Q4962 TaxID=2942202 RepID=UPI0020740D2A|nr:hypothetical protein [Achromobacter sp. Marseille-Q4962]